MLIFTVELKILNCEPKFEELNNFITLIYWRTIMLTQVNVFFVNNSWLMIRQFFIHSWGTLLIDGNVTFFFYCRRSKMKADRYCKWRRNVYGRQSVLYLAVFLHSLFNKILNLFLFFLCWQCCFFSYINVYILIVVSRLSRLKHWGFLNNCAEKDSNF